MSIDQAGAAIGPKTSTAPDSRAVKGKATDAEEAPEGGFFLLLSAISPAVELPAVQQRAVDESVSTPPPAIEKDLKEEVALLANEGLIAEGRGFSAINPAASGADRFNRDTRTQEIASTKPPASESLLAPTDLKVVEGDLVQTAAAQGIDPRVQKAVQARHALGEDIRADLANARLELRAVKAASEIDLGGKDAMQAKVAMVGDFAARFLEPMERPRGKSFGSAGNSGAEAGWTQYAHHARTTMDAPSNFNAMVTMPAQAQVADKVSYWVTQGIQNAELTLDGFGADPVEVSILLKGGEAHVGFRSDQPEVRQMLEGALSQLKDSLEREGVVLSGVTVGGSGADGGGRQQGQRRDPAANRVGGAAQAASENRILRAPTSVGRSLDIFV
jgi:hypothetical protein